MLLNHNKMGTLACSGDRPSLNEYENKIAYGEKCIGWQDVKMIDLVVNLKIFSRNYALNVNAFILAC